MESPVLEICLDESDFLLNALDAAIQDDTSDTVPLDVNTPAKLPEILEADSLPDKNSFPVTARPSSRKRVTFAINHRRPWKSTRLAIPRRQPPSPPAKRLREPEKVQSETTARNSYQARPSSVAIHLPVQKWPLCWRCGYPGHSRENCYLPPRLFCSRCGLIDIMSKDCPCPASPITTPRMPTQPTVRKSTQPVSSSVSRGIQCYLYPPHLKPATRDQATQCSPSIIGEDHTMDFCEV